MGITRLYLKKYKKKEKNLEKAGNIRYTKKAVTLIAMKREVAAPYIIRNGRFFRGANVKLRNWRQVTVRITEEYHLPVRGQRVWKNV